MKCFYFKKIYVEGDFSFIKNKFRRESLIHDYFFILKIIKNINESKPHLFFPEERYEGLVCKAHPSHTEESFKKNVILLNYILNNGWEDFVLNYNYIKRKL
jgi:hypothetical protein